MKIEWKSCFRLGLTVFLTFLAIHYWSSFTGFLGALLGAAGALILGCVIAYVLNILMSFYEKHYFTKWENHSIVKKTKRGVCLIAAILTLLGIVTLVVWIVIPELILAIQLLISEIPPIIEKVLKSEFVMKTLPEDIISQFSSINWNDFISKGTQYLTSGIGNALSTVVNTVSTVTSTFVTGVISVIFAIYFLLSKEQLQRQSKKVLHIYLPTDVEQKVLHVLAVLNDCFHRYVVGQCVEAVILGLLCSFGMLVFGFPYAVMVGTLIGFTALIPVAGAYIGAAVGAIMILTISPVKALLFLVFIVVLQQLEGNLIYPKVVGKSVGLPAVWVLAGVTIGGGLFGIVGMLIGVPLVSAFYRLLHEDMIRRESEMSANV